MKYSTKKKIIRWANIALTWNCLEMIRSLVAVKLVPYTITSDFADAAALIDLYEQYAVGGLVVSVGFLPALILKLYQQNLLVALICSINLTVFYINTYVLS